MSKTVVFINFMDKKTTLCVSLSLQMLGALVALC